MNRISVRQLFELRQQTKRNNIIAGEVGTGKHFLVKLEIIEILASTEDKVIVATDDCYEYEKQHYGNRISVCRKEEEIAVLLEDTAVRKHIYVYAKDFSGETLLKWLADTENRAYDVTVICNGDISDFAEAETCFTVLDISSMSAETGKIIARKTGYKNTDYISRYMNVVATDGRIYELKF